MSDVHDLQIAHEIPWKPPVIAAVVGAVLVAAFVIYAVVSGPAEDPEADAARPVPSQDLPPGYQPMHDGSSRSDDVGLKMESVERSGGSTTVVVSAAVSGMADPAQLAPPDVAYWEIGPEGDRTTMDHQIASPDAPGTTTIVFPREVVPSEAVVVAHPVLETASARMEIAIEPEKIAQDIPFSLEVGSDRALSGRIRIGDGWGAVEWGAPNGSVGRLDVAVTFEGTENPAADMMDPIRLVPAFDSTAARPGTVITPRPLWAFGGAYGLHGDGRLLADGGEATAIVIELTGEIVAETSAPVVLEAVVDDG